MISATAGSRRALRGIALLFAGMLLPAGGCLRQSADPQDIRLCGNGALDPGEECDFNGPGVGDECNWYCSFSGQLQWAEVGEPGDAAYHMVVTESRVVTVGRRGGKSWLGVYNFDGEELGGVETAQAYPGVLPDLLVWEDDKAYAVTQVDQGMVVDTIHESGIGLGSREHYVASAVAGETLFGHLHSGDITVVRNHWNPVEETWAWHSAELPTADDQGLYGIDQATVETTPGPILSLAAFSSGPAYVGVPGAIGWYEETGFGEGGVQFLPLVERPGWQPDQLAKEREGSLIAVNQRESADGTPELLISRYDLGGNLEAESVVASATQLSALFGDPHGYMLWAGRTGEGGHYVFERWREDGHRHTGVEVPEVANAWQVAADRDTFVYVAGDYPQVLAKYTP